MSFAALADPGPLPGRHEVDARLVAAIAVLTYTVLLLSGERLLNDPDSHWHVFIGQKILSERAFPVVDAYSHTFSGAPWIAKEWLSQVLFALAHRAAGWTGVIAVAALAGAGAFAILAHELLRRLGWRPALILMGAAFLLAAPHMLARPHVLALPVLALWIAVCLRAAEAGRAPPLLAALLMALWANLHGSFLFGLAFGGLFVAEAVMRAAAADRLRVFMGWAVFGALALAATALHPYGPESVLAGFRVLGLGEAQSIIGEWRSQDFSRFSAFEALLLAGVGASLALGLKLSPFRVLLLLALVHMALAHVRHMTLIGLIGPLLIAPALASAGADVRPKVRRGAAIALGLAMAIAASVAAAFQPPPQPASRNSPAEALAAARAAGLAGPVLNDYDFGGYLITAGVPTLIDGRTELFGGPFVAAYAQAVSLQDLDGLERLLAERRIAWTLLHRSTPAVAYLDRHPGWRRVHGDAVAVVHARR